MFSTICKNNSSIHNELITQEKGHEIADIPLKEPSCYKTPQFFFFFKHHAVRGQDKNLILAWKACLGHVTNTNGFLKGLKPATIYDGDQGTASKDLVQVPIGPVTRARAKKFKDVLNRLIQELWAQANSWRPIEHDPRGQQRIVTLIQVLEGSGQG